VGADTASATLTPHRSGSLTAVRRPFDPRDDGIRYWAADDRCFRSCRGQSRRAGGGLAQRHVSMPTRTVHIWPVHMTVSWRLT
jgi:hypothetical protein